MLTLGLRLISTLVASLPEAALRPLAAMLGGLLFDVLGYRRRVILENLAVAFPELGVAERRRLGREAMRHLVLTLLEFLRIPRYAARGFEGRVRLVERHHLDRARARGRGVLCLTGHLGSFELAVAAAAREWSPIALVVKAFPPAVDRLVRGIREASGLSVLYAEGGARPILRALARGELVGFALDQNATRAQGVFVDFFGRPASTLRSLAQLAILSGAPVVPAIPWRAEDGTHVLELHPEIPLEERESREETVRHMTAVYTAALEAAIRRHPAQWFWTHKRWRTRPRP